MLTILSSLFLATNAFATPTVHTDALLSYARTHYTPATELNVTRTESWSSEQESPCAWTQSFEGGVTYTHATYECDGGSTTTLRLPPMPLHEAKILVEAFHKKQGADNTFEWSGSRTPYRFENPELSVGCAFTVDLTEQSLFIELFCGC